MEILVDGTGMKPTAVFRIDTAVPEVSLSIIFAPFKIPVSKACKAWYPDLTIEVVGEGEGCPLTVNTLTLS